MVGGKYNEMQVLYRKTAKKDSVKCNNCGESFCAKTAERAPAITGVAKCPYCGVFNVIDKGETK